MTNFLKLETANRSHVQLSKEGHVRKMSRRMKRKMFLIKK